MVAVVMFLTPGTNHDKQLKKKKKKKVIFSLAFMAQSPVAWFSLKSVAKKQKPAGLCKKSFLKSKRWSQESFKP